MDDYRFCLGMDDVGTGSIAGPVTVGCVLVPINKQDELTKLGAKDSKKVTEGKRNAFYNRIVREEHPFHFDYRIEYRSASTIDKKGLTEATSDCVETILIDLYKQYGDQIEVVYFDRGLKPRYFKEFVVPDTLKIIEAPCKGEDLYPSVAAASILAKVERDFLMSVLGKQYPEYGFQRHKGYGSTQHYQAIKDHGPLQEIHRFSFLKNVL